MKVILKIATVLVIYEVAKLLISDTFLCGWISGILTLWVLEIYDELYK
jgi:hypothetical protein